MTDKNTHPISQEEITNQIKNGMFFKESLDWYLSQFTVSYSFRALAVVLLLACLGLFSLSIFNVYSMFPLERPFTLVKLVDRGEDEFSVVKKLDEKHKLNIPAEDLVSQHLVEEYAERYEAYSFADIDNNTRFIKNSSARSVYLNYQKKMNSNPLIAEQSEHYKKLVTIVSSKLEESDGTNKFVKKALVTFEVRDLESEATTKRKTYQARIQFNMSNLKMALSKLVPFGFSVTSYEIVDEY